ncbi:holo-ACP synthase [Undibacterium sp. Ren11W]|uniref:holo-ACP synthase n=1 Tax=Undibacterium sp. Ren11W TaxID=3413045 RepID=UPI003BF2DF9E
MIFGIGTDIVQISRIEAALLRSGERFAEKILGDDEIHIYLKRKAKSHALGVKFLASRFAAKEAFSKALGLGMRAPMSWQSVQVTNEIDGQPSVVLSGPISEWVSERGLVAKLSLSDEVEYALAFVLIEHLNLH